jgi:hypothetical protein
LRFHRKTATADEKLGIFVCWKLETHKITIHFFSVRTENDFSALRVTREDELSPFSYALLFAFIFRLPAGA